MQRPLSLAPAPFADVARRLIGNGLWWAVSIGSVVVLWELLGGLRLINTVILPTPHETLAEIRNQAQFISPAVAVANTEGHLAAVSALLSTLQRVFIGLVLAFTASFLVGG